MRRERRVDGAGLRRSRVGRNAIAAIARIETLNHTCCWASISFQRGGIVSKCAYAPRPSSSRGGLLADWPPPHGLLAARAALPVQHAATIAHILALQAMCTECAVQCAVVCSAATDAISTVNSTCVLCRCVLWVCGAGRPLLCRVLSTFCLLCLGASVLQAASPRVSSAGGRARDDSSSIALFDCRHRGRADQLLNQASQAWHKTEQ